MRKLRTPEARARMPKWGTKFVPAPALCIGDVLVKQVLKWERINPQPSQERYETHVIPFRCTVTSIEPIPVPARDGGFVVQCMRVDDVRYVEDRQEFDALSFWVPPETLFEVKP